jgi:DNA-directed RNA polymerase II subunit RPB2
MEAISWKLIDKYFKENPYNLVAHHLDSYDSFFSKGIYNIFKENNPIRFIERQEKEEKEEETREKGKKSKSKKGDSQEEEINEILLYLGGETGEKLYFGKPVIYDDNYSHYMYPNDARLRNMTYGITIHYDVDIEVTYYENGEKQEKTETLSKIYLGRFPIMLHSNLCILKGLALEARFNVGECRQDYGGYFIIDGKEKTLVSQEKFADNMLYIRANKDDNIYSHSAEIRSVSEDASKPIRTSAVRMVAPSTKYSNQQIVVTVPNVRKPVPLFILMRAFGLQSDKQIIEHCLLNMEKNKGLIDLFIPSIHDAGKIFNQQVALEYIATFTKRRTISGVMDILMNYFLPHIGTDNFLDKAYFVGYMVNRLLKVFTKQEKPTDRDNFKYKRVELAGSLMYDLFREYFLIQKRAISLKIDNEYYYHRGQYKNTIDNFASLIQNNYADFFKERDIEVGFKKAFKGNWGSEEHTKRVGVIQDVNRLSWNSFISQMRKFNLPLDSSAKVVGPRHLHSSQWGYIDPIDTPDGGNIGLHKHMAISTLVTSGTSAKPILSWLRATTNMKLLQECHPESISSSSKIIINGAWVGVIDDPLKLIGGLKLFRRNGLLPVYMSISFDYNHNEIFMYTDSGRLTRPIYYIDEEKRVSYKNNGVNEQIESGEFTWEQVISGFGEKPEDFDIQKNKVYDIKEFFKESPSVENVQSSLHKNRAIVDYIDPSEEEGALIATSLEELKKSKYYTHVEIHPSLILGVLGNSIIYPENNPPARNAFSCGQSKQAVSLYHSNHQMRIDKMGVVLNYGQVPLTKSRYLDYINKEQMPYGINTIVAIMCYTGYNVEDAILVNEAALHRGLFRTTYYSMYEAREESTKVAGSTSSSTFDNVSGKNVVGIKPGYDYSHLDKHGLVKENTPLDDKIVVIGKVTASSLGDANAASIDSSVFPKKGQLGFVDRAFITEGEEGFRLAKIRVREDRIPAIGDKMASRCGQKGTIGLIIPEEDMPFTKDGLKPDLIINPHALPSRMTIGQLIESLLGKLCLEMGGHGDCTAFTTMGSNTEVYGDQLVKAGFHSSGNQVMYNGMTGEQIYSDIYIGPTYYMRLKHMVKDKINYRARGPNTMLTRQPVQGRANDGGLRIGEMERDGIMAHGASAFLNESFMVRGDEYYMAVCNKTGCIAVYNSSLNLFVSPFADGPLQFTTTLDGKMNIKNMSRFGRSFSIVRVPYSLKLLIHELQAMNIQMRIITEDNIDQLMNMSFSNNIQLLLDDDREISKVIESYKKKNAASLKTEDDRQAGRLSVPIEKTTPSFDSAASPAYVPTSPAYQPNSPAYQPNSPQYDPNSPQYHTETPSSKEEGYGGLNSPQYSPHTPEEEAPRFIPSSPSGTPPPPEDEGTHSVTPYKPITFEPRSPEISPIRDTFNAETPASRMNIKDEKVKAEFDALPERDQRLLMKMINKKKEDLKQEAEANMESPTAILNLEEEKKEEEKKEGDEKEGSSGGSIKKVVTFS